MFPTQARSDLIVTANEEEFIHVYVEARASFSARTTGVSVEKYAKMPSSAQGVVREYVSVPVSEPQGTCCVIYNELRLIPPQNVLYTSTLAAT